MVEILQRQDDPRGDAPADVVVGDLVCVREGVWRVMEVRTFARSPPVPPVRTRVLKLMGADAANRWQPCTLLEPFDRPRRVEAARAPRVVSRARWMRTCAALVAASPPSGCPATIADARVTLLPHQIDPVLAVLRGRASRLLLADAVGLGKTIQAALLVRELRARGCADRVLVLVPSGLREQWRQELSHRTGQRAEIIDAAALAARVRDLPPDVNPWSLPGIAIVSLDFIKQPAVLRGASAIVWDILIADEAHNLNEGTDRLAAAGLLARHSRHVILLTATPHHGSDGAFATLCSIGRVGRIGHLDRGGDLDPIVIFRRTRQTLGLGRTRKVHVLRVTPTKQERRLHTLLARYAGRVERECDKLEGTCGEAETAAAAPDARPAAPARIDVGSEASMPFRVAPRASRNPCDESHPASLAMSILLKRASSSAWSLERSLRRRLALLEGRALSEDHTRAQFVLPFADRSADVHDGDDTDSADGEPSHVLGTPGLRSARIERAWLTLLIEVARNAARDESKPRALARFLRRCREPALIYTEYRDTLTHVARTLAGAMTGPIAKPSTTVRLARRSPGPSPSAEESAEPGHAAAAASASLAMLHGGLGADERRSALARFTSGDARVLLTTDAAGEGLNLHHRCRLVINVELPWNPNRLEQRIGRVDRLGQTRTVHAIHLVAANTAEEPMLARLTSRLEQIAAALGDAPTVLRTSREGVFPDTGTTQGADAVTAATFADDPNVRRAAAEASGDADSTRPADAADSRARADASVAPDVANELASCESDLPTEGVASTAADARATCRSISAEAMDVAGQLQRLRAMRARAWRAVRPRPNSARPNGASTPRGDPLLALDERAPLIAVVRRRTRAVHDRRDAPRPSVQLPRHARARVEHDERRPRTSPFAEPRLPGTHELSTHWLSPHERSTHEHSADARSAHALSAQGLLWVWRTRLARDDGQTHARPGPSAQALTTVLTAIHVVCEVPTFTSHKAVAAFVGATLERCGARIAPLLGNELAAARERLHATERARVERLARRDEAIAYELASTLRAGATCGGMFQPLLFDDIAIEKTRMTGETDGRSDRHPVTRPTQKNLNAMDSVDEADEGERVESTLVMALVVR